MDMTKPVSRRTLLAGAAAAGAVVATDSLLPGSALASRQEADVVTLQFWTNHDATDVPLFQHVIRNFEATHPNIKIKMTNETSSTYDTTLISTHAVSGTLPNSLDTVSIIPVDRVAWESPDSGQAAGDAPQPARWLQGPPCCSRQVPKACILAR